MSNSKEKKRFGATMLLWLAKGVAALPHWVQFGVIGNFIYFVMRYLLRYRRELIVRQIAGSFPEKSREEVLAIANDYYHTLAESIICTLSLSASDEKQRMEALQIDVPEEIRQLVEGKHFVLFSSHHNMWEYAQFTSLYFNKHHLLCAYHPLSSPAFEEFYYRLRSELSSNVSLAPSNRFLHNFIKHSKTGIDGRQVELGIIADQNAPPRSEDNHWFDFLHRPTLFFEGGEYLAKKFHIPAVYLSMSRVSAGKYRGEIKLVYDGVEQVENHEITERYVRLLEQDIHREPSRWMWSHRRWKYYPDPVTGEAIYCRKGL